MNSQKLQNRLLNQGKDYLQHLMFQLTNFSIPSPLSQKDVTSSVT